MIYRNWETSCLNRAEAAEAELNRMMEEQEKEEKRRYGAIIEAEIELINLRNIAIVAKQETKNIREEIENTKDELVKLEKIKEKTLNSSRLPQKKTTKKTLQKVVGKILFGILCMLFIIASAIGLSPILSKEVIVGIFYIILIAGVTAIFTYNMAKE
jgi:hypothetical protein